MKTNANVQLKRFMRRYSEGNSPRMHDENFIKNKEEFYNNRHNFISSDAADLIRLNELIYQTLKS